MVDLTSQIVYQSPAISEQGVSCLKQGNLIKVSGYVRITANVPTTTVLMTLPFPSAHRVDILAKQGDQLMALVIAKNTANIVTNASFTANSYIFFDTCFFANSNALAMGNPNAEG